MQQIPEELVLKQKPIKQICRELKVSRKVVRKVIRSEATAFRYTRTSQPAPKLGPWREALDGMLLANAGKAPRERLTLIRVFEALRGLGYEGGYDAVRRYAADSQPKGSDGSPCVETGSAPAAAQASDDMAD